MYIPLQLRLTLFYTVILGFALWFFGHMAYTQAEQRAYNDLDNTLSSRAASVRLSKFLACGINTGNGQNTYSPLSSVDGLGTGGVAIEVLDDHLHLLASTNGQTGDYTQTVVDGLGSSPVPWDAKAAQQLLKKGASAVQANRIAIYSTITYQGQHVRIYSLINDFCGQSIHIIQTARSEQDVEQSLSDLQGLLLRGGALVLALALVGGWFITWGVLSAVRRMTKTAHAISTSQNFSQRVPDTSWWGRDELVILATTLNEMLANLEKLYFQQQRFIADASHELRAPITSIRCNLDLLTKAPDLPTEEAQAALSDARAEADRMGRLVSDLLALARSDALSQTERNSIYGYKKDEVEKEQIDLDSLLLEVFRQYHPLEEHERDNPLRQGPRLLLQHITPARVYGRADQLKQVLVALLDNALKYTHDGSVSLSLTLQEETAIVKVSDTGIGIAAEDLPHIFERFYRADRARSRDQGGSGLGLAIVKSIIHGHEGSIEVESSLGKGSTFIVKLPMVQN